MRFSARRHERRDLAHRLYNRFKPRRMTTLPRQAHLIKLEKLFRQTEPPLEQYMMVASEITCHEPEYPAFAILRNGGNASDSCLKRAVQGISFQRKRDMQTRAKLAVLILYFPYFPC